jgi:lipopolysaccharide export system protein LptA
MRPVANSFVLPTCLALAALLPLAATANTADRSDSVLTGNVAITQGTLQVHADKAVIHRKGGDITQVELTGTPATLKQVADNGDPMTAHASLIVYTLNSDLIVLTGGVVVEQPRGNLRGETIKYDLKTGRLDGGGDGNRVQMRILPKNPPAGGTP